MTDNEFDTFFKSLSSSNFTIGTWLAGTTVSSGTNSIGMSDLQLTRDVFITVPKAPRTTYMDWLDSRRGGSAGGG